MSLAWGSLVLVVALLPGVLFFVGLHFPERFSRDVASRTALGQLAGVLLISFIVHGVHYVVSPAYCGGSLPCVDFERFVGALTLDRTSSSALSRVAENVSQYRAWILAYVLLTAVAGTLMGWWTGSQVVKGRFRFLTQHRWIYRLSVGNQLTSAWVLTNIRDGNRVLVYRGWVHDFHLKQDGTFSNLILEDVRRGYLVLGDKWPSMSQGGEWPLMGRSTRAADSSPKAKNRYAFTLFAIEGEDIANVVFDRYTVKFDMKISDEELEAAIMGALEAFGALTSQSPRPRRRNNRHDA